MARSKQSTSTFSSRCENCGKTKKTTEFAKNKFSPNGAGVELWCRSCRTKNVIDKESLILYLELNNLKFNEELWIKSFEQAKEGFSKKYDDVEELPNDVEQKLTKKAIGHYLRQRNLGQFSDVPLDSNLIRKGTKLLDKNLIAKWGSGYEKEQYEQLEEFYNDMKRSYEIETASHIDYLKKICKISLKMDEALEKDMIDGFKKLSDTYDKLMHSAKFTAAQRNAADSAGGLNTFGEFFELIEKEGFIPKWHNNEPQDIVDATIDNMKQFTRKLVLGDPNIAQIVEQSVSKINEKEQIEREHLYDDTLDENSEEYYLDMEDEIEDDVTNG